MTKSDRELLELAAKAAEYVLWTDEYDGLFLPDPMRRWNPLQDDGDALRLAVATDQIVEINRADRFVGVQCGYRGEVTVTEDFGSDMFAATRRAIVRAAAEIGGAL